MGHENPMTFCKRTNWSRGSLRSALSRERTSSDASPAVIPTDELRVRTHTQTHTHSHTHTHTQKH